MGGRLGKDIKLIMKTLEEHAYWTVSITNEQVEIHSTNKRTEIHEPRSSISLKDVERTRQLLGLLEPLGEQSENDVAKAFLLLQL
jgi:hypothetical protein